MKHLFFTVVLVSSFSFCDAMDYSSKSYSGMVANKFTEYFAINFPLYAHCKTKEEIQHFIAQISASDMTKEEAERCLMGITQLPTLRFIGDKVILLGLGESDGENEAAGCEKIH